MKEKHLYRSILWGISLFGVLCFIFANSLTPASASTEESRSFFTAFLSLFPHITHRIVRKIAHLAEYALLGAHLSFAPILLPMRARATYPLTLLFGAAVALLDEGIQYFVPGRGASFADVLLDFAGYLIGLLLMLAFFLILTKIRRGQRNA